MNVQVVWIIVNSNYVLTLSFLHMLSMYWSLFFAAIGVPSNSSGAIILEQSLSSALDCCLALLVPNTIARQGKECWHSHLKFESLD